MKKNYKFDDENKEDNGLGEPVAEYKRILPKEYSLSLTESCPSLLANTPENVKKVAWIGLEQIRNGQFKTHEETLKEFDV